MKTVLFVCTGNTCRSPMAAALFQHLCGNNKKNIISESAGLAVLSEEDAAKHAVLALEEKGIDLSGHKSRPLTRELCERADWIVPMTSAHRQALERAGVPPEKIFLIGEIADPYGGSLDDYRRCRDMLTDALSALCEKVSSDD